MRAPLTCPIAVHSEVDPGSLTLTCSWAGAYWLIRSPLVPCSLSRMRPGVVGPGSLSCIAGAWVAGPRRRAEPAF